MITLSNIRLLTRFRPSRSQLINRLHYELARPQERLRYRPIWLLLYLTDACNLRCRMCPHHTTEPMGDFPYLKQMTYNMPAALVEEILRRFPEALVVNLAGVGEPLLHPNFVQIIDLLERSNKLIDITTNGYLLAGLRLEALLGSRLVREVSISLNGSTGAEHTYITARKGFDKVRTNVTALVSGRSRTRGPRVISVSQVCTIENQDRWRDYVHEAADMGVDRIYLHSIIDMNVQANDLRSLRETERLQLRLAELPAMAGKTRVIKPKLVSSFRPPPKCEWFFKNLAFDAEGNLGSCGRVMNPQPQYGNLRRDNDDIWNNEYMRRLRRTFLDRSGSQMEQCCYTCIENF